MDSAVARQLVELNRRFYADFGTQFSATRQRIQPGVKKVVSMLDGNERILDLGCGNGELARTLARSGFHGGYLGLDFSLPLLKEAETQPRAFPIKFLAVDLTTDWASVIARGGRSSLSKPGPEAISSSNGEIATLSAVARNDTFDLITAFATLHHVPSRELRLNILLQIHSLLASSGRFTHSNWQFLNSEKLKGRIQPWKQVGLSAADVDEGDYLLDWRGGGHGLRYVHHFTEPELGQLATETGFRVAQSFLSDGENERLGLYQVWEKL
jgi:2-polyprenyl-3-methyl-5-hydroxy-6-metoxy-1,4-benzoquinol methylase